MRNWDYICMALIQDLPKLLMDIIVLSDCMDILEDRSML